MFTDSDDYRIRPVSRVSSPSKLQIQRSLTSPRRVMKRFILYFALFAAFSVGGSSAALSDIIIEFSDGTTTGTNFHVTAGDTITFFVFVSETGANTELSTDGLVGFGLHADYSASSGTSALVTANSVDPGFDSTFDDSFNATQLNLAGNIITNPAPQASTIPLGQFNVTTSAAGVTNFVFADYDLGQSDFVTPSSVDLDPTIFSGGRTFGLTLIAAVPEPGASILLLIGIHSLIRRRRSKF